jgi:hypothetical protein
MIRHLAATIACGLCLLDTARAQENQFSDSMIEKTLLISAEEKERLSALEAKGIMEIRPVALPTGSHLIGDNH